MHGLIISAVNTTSALAGHAQNHGSAAQSCHRRAGRGQDIRRSRCDGMTRPFKPAFSAMLLTARGRFQGGSRVANYRAVIMSKPVVTNGRSQRQVDAT